MHIHWHEGLFLLPHHLQIFQRQVAQGLNEERRLHAPFSHGVIEVEISTEDLENHRLRFSRLHCVFPGGRRVRFPEEGELPTRSFQKELQEKGDLLVSVAIPVWKAERANTLLEEHPGMEQAKILFLTREKEYADENTGANPKAVIERRINARLLLGGEEQTDLEVLPLLRIVRETGEELGRPKIDPTFAGPCLHLQGSGMLRECAQSIASLVDASRQELAVQLNRGGFSLETMRGMQFEQLLRLQSLNQSSARLRLLLGLPSLTPLEYYRELLDLLARLMALHPDREISEFPRYDHEQPLFSFHQIINRLQFYLRGAVAARFERLPFQRRDGFLQARLTDDQLQHTKVWYLGIVTKEDPSQLSRLVQNEDRFKLTPPSMADRAVRGIPLQEDRFPPLELPAQTGLFYFRLQLQQAAEVWQMVQQEKLLVARWSGQETSDFQLALYLPISADA